MSTPAYEVTPRNEAAHSSYAPLRPQGIQLAEANELTLVAGTSTKRQVLLPRL